jgi:hypothetical protein
MRVENYTHFGGTHYESANLKNLMAWARAVNPLTGQPFTEAECIGIAGGIAAGYQWCPSLPGWDIGSGVSVIALVKRYSTNGSWYRDFFARLGIPVDIRETGGAKAALANMREPLEQGQPVVAWCSPMRVCPIASWNATCGMYSVVVHSLDESAAKASYGDHAATSHTISIDDLMWSRNRVCSLKNRTLTFARPNPLAAATVKKAYEAGIRECAGDFAKPKLGTFNLPGLEEWTKLIANSKNKRGWLAAFPGGRIYRRRPHAPRLRRLPLRRRHRPPQARPRRMRRKIPRPCKELDRFCRSTLAGHSEAIRAHQAPPAQARRRLHR